MTSHRIVKIITGFRGTTGLGPDCAPVVVLIVVLVVLAIFRSPPRREPVYAGRTITAWLDGGYEPAAMALQDVGPSAIPWVFQNLRREHPTWSGRPAYLELRRHVPALFIRIFPVPKATGFDALRAANLLIGMGPPVIPALKDGLKDRNPAVRAACGMALNNLAPKTAVGPQQPL